MVNGGRLEAVARYLVELLNTEPYRSDWLMYATHPRTGTVSRAAVANVLAQYLWDAGLADEHNRNLPRELKDRVGRALNGEVLSPETLGNLAHAFGFDEEEVTELWARYGRALSEVDSETGPGHRTISLHEFHYLGASGLPERHRTVHVVKAMVEGLVSYPYLFDTDLVEVTVERGGTASAMYRRADGLFGVDILFGRPLQRGEIASFEYHIQFHYGALDTPTTTFRRQAVRRVENMEMRAQFHQEKQPVQIWWTSWDGREGPPLEREPLDLDADRAVHKYVAAVQNQTVGFSWQW